MKRELSGLFSPVKINRLELKNRAVMPAMGTGFGGMDGTVTDRLVSYLERRAAGGTGLIITEVCAVDPRGKGFPAEIGAWTDEFIPGLSRVPEAANRHGAAAALQLHHAGRETFGAFAGGTPEAPSAVPSQVLMQPCEEMSIRRISEVIGAYASAAGRAKASGFDAVEIHGAHGYLIGQFLSPLSNIREDEYGGSDENRARFALDVLRAVRDIVGPGFPIIFRLSAEELVRGGYELAFTEWLAPLLVDAGADALHVSVGVFATPGNLTIASEDTEPGFNLPRARAIKQVVDVPVIGVGRVSDPRLADEAIARGDADLVSFGRQHLADPDFLAKAARGEFDRIRWCLACNQGCIERMSFEFKPVTCAINPSCGSEHEIPALMSGGARKVWVVGAGPAGLSAALAAVECGHEVDVFEGESEPGGQLRMACKPPAKCSLGGWVEWAVRELGSRGVALHLGTRVDSLPSGEGRPDYVVVATGALPAAPAIGGIDGDNVADARDVLLGRAETKDAVTILGAGYVGMEAADYLIARGVDVTVLEARSDPPVNRMTAHGYWLTKRLADSGGELLLGAEVLAIEPDAVIYRQGGEEKSVGSSETTVVVALGAKPETGLVSMLEREGVPFKVVGDAVDPRRLLEAVHEGDAAGRALPFSSA